TPTPLSRLDGALAPKGSRSGFLRIKIIDIRPVFVNLVDGSFSRLIAHLPPVEGNCMRSCRMLALIFAGWIIAPGFGITAAGAEEFFEKSIRPVLAANCFECHGPRRHKAGLRLDSREAMLAGGESGPAIVPGAPEKSLLIKAIHYQDEPRMP